MLAPRSFWIDGSATFTTVLSSMTMNRAKHMAASVHHLRLPSCRRMRSGMRGVLSACGGKGAGHDRLQHRGELAALLRLEACDEVVDAADAHLEQALRDRTTLGGQFDELAAAVLRVLRPRDEPALEQAVDRAAGSGEGDAELVAERLDRARLVAAGEGHEQLRLGERHVELVECLEHRAVAALEQIAQEQPEVADEGFVA